MITINGIPTMIDKTDGLVRTKPRDPEKVRVFCIMTKEAVESGVIFSKNNKILEILPWEN